jgi:UDP-glucuronate decarboxylase
MHVFITGGTGFFGKALLRYWSSGDKHPLEDARLTILSRDPTRFCSAHGELLAKLNVSMIKGDIQNPSTLPTDDYTHILHAATDSTIGLSLTPLQRFDQIVEGTRNVLDLALRCDNPRVLVTSSGGVYGDISQFTHGVPEDYNGIPDPLSPHNAYSIAKRQAEHLCTLYGHSFGLEFVIARCFTFFGEDLPLGAHFAIGNFVRDALAGEDIVILGNGMPVRSYMDQRDLARWLSTLLIRGQAGRAYNVGSENAISIADLAHRIANIAPGRRPNVRILKRMTEGQAAHRDVYLPDVSRAREEMDLQSEFHLDEMIHHAMARLMRS